MRMRNIFCSFRNEENLKKFGVKIGFKNMLKLNLSQMKNQIMNIYQSCLNKRLVIKLLKYGILKKSMKQER